MSVANAVTPAVLDYLDHGIYPEAEEVPSADLSSDVLSQLVIGLNQARDAVKNELRKQSKATAPDIDSWIAKAKELQEDILRSREIARQIVAEAETGDGLAAIAADTEQKVALLQKEVGFNEALYGTLEHIQYANRLLDRVQDEAVKGNVDKALDRLEDAESSIAGLQSIETTKAYDMVHRRAGTLKENLVEAATECWHALINVSQDDGGVSIMKQGLAADLPEGEVPSVGLDAIVTVVKGLGVFDKLARIFSRDLENVILRPRLTIDEDARVPTVTISGNTLALGPKSSDISIPSLLRDIYSVLDFLATRFPASITDVLSEVLLPRITPRFEEKWLRPAVPVSVQNMTAFQVTLSDISTFAEQIDALGWKGSQAFHEWVENAPRIWVTKRRETLLGDVRNLIFSGLWEKKVVERVETQMVTKEEARAVTGGGADEDDWDAAWDEPEERALQNGQDAPENSNPAAEEDMSAWDDEDEGVEKPTTVEDDEDTSAWDVEDEPAKKPSNVEDEDAWGWGDGDEEPTTQQATKGAPSKPPASAANGQGGGVEREITLRETFTVTQVPDGILEIVQQLISDAEALAGPDFVSSPIAPAAAALYSLPTLALAIYRATAPTAYNKLDTGNMLIYNDASRLADRLRSWQDDRPKVSRLRLDNDLKALESFAKSAYSSEMESQRTILRDLVDGAQGFSNCTVPPYKGDCESAVEQSIDRLRDVYKLWQDVLSSSALLQSLGALLATVTGKIISDIEDLGDIGEADSRQLKALIDSTTTVTDLFLEQNQPKASKMDMTFIYCPNWTKFLYLAEILDSSLADIKYMWNEGELSLEYHGEEIVELVEALFAESDLRRQAVREIRRGGRV